MISRKHVDGWQLGDLGLKTQVCLGQKKWIIPCCNGKERNMGPAICEVAASVSVSACKLDHSHCSAARTNAQCTISYVGVCMYV